MSKSLELLNLTESRKIEIVKQYNEIINKWEVNGRPLHIEEARSAAKTTLIRVFKQSSVGLSSRFWSIKPMMKEIIMFVSEDLQLLSAQYQDQIIKFPLIKREPIEKSSMINVQRKIETESVYNFQTIQNIKF